MIKSAQYHRLLWMTVLVVIAFFGLGWRLIDLQYLTADKTWEQFEERSMVEYVIVPWRGDITDRHKTPLAVSVRNYDLGVDPSYVGSFYVDVARAIGPILNQPVDVLANKIRPREYEDKNGKLRKLQYVSIARSVSHETLVQVKAALNEIGQDWDEYELTRTERQRLRNVRKRGAYVSREVQMRRYPNGSMCAPVLGLVNDRNQPSTDEKTPSHFIQYGANGIEAALNAQLAGTYGRIRKVRTELVDQITEQFDARDGMNVALTIDRRLQEALDEQLAMALKNLDARNVFGIVMDVKTGEILAVGGSPTFDPSNRSSFRQEFGKILSFTEAFEPGSIIKAVPIAAALNENVVNLSTEIFCENGTWYGPSTPLTDAHAYGVLTVSDIVKKSSNIGTAKVAGMLGNSLFYDYMRKFGLGVKTGVGLYEEQGLLWPKSSYKPVDFTRLPIGYASAVTQLQIACIYSAIANGGVLMRPQILSRIEGREGNVEFKFSPQPLRRVVTERASREMMKALQTVTEDGGTAVRAALDYYTVAGKTGTAHKYDGAAYNNKEYYSSFVGVFPASAPEICIAITVDTPNKKLVGHYGGAVAGPVFVEVANLVGQHLNIQPDKEPESSGDPSTSADKEP